MHISPQATKSVRGFRFRKEAKNSVTQALQTCTKGAVRAPRRGLTRRVDSDLLNPRQPGFLHLTVAWAPRIIWKCLRTITATRRFGMRAPVDIDPAILLAVRAGVHSVARAPAEPGHLGLPVNGTEEPDGDMAGVHHMQSWISLSPRATLRPRLT